MIAGISTSTTSRRSANVIKKKRVTNFCLCPLIVISVTSPIISCTMKECIEKGFEKRKRGFEGDNHGKREWVMFDGGKIIDRSEDAEDGWLWLISRNPGKKRTAIITFLNTKFPVFRCAFGRGNLIGGKTRYDEKSHVFKLDPDSGLEILGRECSKEDIQKNVTTDFHKTLPKKMKKGRGQWQDLIAAWKGVGLRNLIILDTGACRIAVGKDVADEAGLTPMSVVLVPNSSPEIRKNSSPTNRVRVDGHQFEFIVVKTSIGNELVSECLAQVDDGLFLGMIVLGVHGFIDNTVSVLVGKRLRVKNSSKDYCDLDNTDSSDLRVFTKQEANNGLAKLLFGEFDLEFAPRTETRDDYIHTGIQVEAEQLENGKEKAKREYLAKFRSPVNDHSTKQGFFRRFKVPSVFIETQRDRSKNATTSIGWYENSKEEFKHDDVKVGCSVDTGCPFAISLPNSRVRYHGFSQIDVYFVEEGKNTISDRYKVDPPGEISCLSQVNLHKNINPRKKLSKKIKYQGYAIKDLKKAVEDQKTSAEELLLGVSGFLDRFLVIIVGVNVYPDLMSNSKSSMMYICEKVPEFLGEFGGDFSSINKDLPESEDFRDLPEEEKENCCEEWRGSCNVQ